MRITAVKAKSRWTAAKHIQHICKTCDIWSLEYVYILKKSNNLKKKKKKINT